MSIKLQFASVLAVTSVKHLHKTELLLKNLSTSTMEQVESPLHVRLPVIILTVLFGIGSWIAIGGIWVELPLLVSLNIPENYNLASYLTVIIQLANVGPLIFSLANYFVSKDKRIEIPTIFIILALGCISTFLMIFFWDSFTVWQIDGQLHSTALLVLTFFISVVACTSSVTFMPFMSILKNSYLTWYFIGQGLSSLLPSIMALIQGVGSQECISNGSYVNRTTVGNKTFEQNCTHWISRDSPARFPPQNFFAFLFAMMFVCGIAYTLLNYLPLAKQEHIYRQPASAGSSTSASPENHDLVVRNPNEGVDPTSATKSIEARPLPPDEPDDTSNEVKCQTGYTLLSKIQKVYLFVLLCVVCMLTNGVMPSIQSFSCGPYGLNTYLLASTLANIVNPVAATLVMLKPSTNLTLMGVTTLLGIAFSFYCMMTAILSPSPPLQHENAGRAFITLAWVCMTSLFVYTKATIAWILRTQPENRSLLIWYGGITQVGSMIGSFIMWPLINVAQTFTPYYEDVCAGFPQCETAEATVGFSEL